MWLKFTLLTVFALYIHLDNCQLTLSSGDVSFDPDKAVTLSFRSILKEEPQPLLRPKRVIEKRMQIINDRELFGFGDTIQQGIDDKGIILGKYITSTDDVPKNPVVSKSKAFDIALKDRRAVGRKGFATFPKTAADDRFKLFYMVDQKDKFELKLVWWFDFLVIRTGKNGSNKLSNAFVMVDATEGEVVSAFEELLTAASNVQMSGDGGNNFVGLHRYGEGRWAGRMLNVTRDGNKCSPVNPVTLVNDVPAGKDFFFPPDQCFDAKMIPKFEESCNPSFPNKDKTDFTFSQVHDALFFATRFQELLLNMYGDNTIRECCGQVKVCTHFPHADNSFYFNSGSCETYYGITGDRTVDMASPSMIGHELGHAFTDCTSRLENKCQPGAIAESFSDLCGVVLKASINSFNTDWKFGSEITRRSGLRTAIRYLNNPSQDGSSIDHVDDYICQDVHFANGVYNKAIFNLVSMPTWSLQTVFQIFIRANKFYWKPKTGFNEGVCGLMEAAKDYNYRAKDVAKAFAQVGVFCSCPETWLTYNEVINHEDGERDENTRTSCIKVVNDKATWAEARTYCRTMNAQLIVLQGKGKSNGLKEGLPSGKSTQYWVGASDLRSEDEWKWVPTNTAVSGFTDWHPNEPNNAKKSQNCMALSRISGVWKWSDESCSMRKSFICELA